MKDILLVFIVFVIYPMSVNAQESSSQVLGEQANICTVVSANNVFDLGSTISIK